MRSIKRFVWTRKRGWNFEMNTFFNMGLKIKSFKIWNTKRHLTGLFPPYKIFFFVCFWWAFWPTRDCQISLIKKGGVFQIFLSVCGIYRKIVFPLYLSPPLLLLPKKKKGRLKDGTCGQILDGFWESLQRLTHRENDPSDGRKRPSNSTVSERSLHLVEKGIHVWCE